MRSPPKGRSLVVPTPRPSAACRLVCFPCAGAGPALFRPLSRQLPEHIELVAACLPGRESRVREAPATHLLRLASEITLELSRLAAGRPYLIFGHSMGAMIAYEVCRWLQLSGIAPLPGALTISASISPDLPRDTEVIGQSDERLTERLASLGGIDPEVAADPALMKLVLPVTRADLEMVEVYQPRLGPPLELELVTVRGSSDHVATAGQMAGWPRIARAAVQHVRPGGHFYLLEPANRAWLVELFTAQAARAGAHLAGSGTAA
ncbi:MAG TPA: alpha/beta fold hydrolase [Mycobacteriales bacterium]|nr:alpha/beta fold hydrolase [Mycobacteriales bacterium]